MVELVVIIALLTLWIVSRIRRRTPVYFASKTLQRHKHEILLELLNETFETFPIYKHITLEVSEHWLRIKKRRQDIWYAKNFVIGASNSHSQGTGLTPPSSIFFCMITGEKRNEVIIPNTYRDIFWNTMKMLKTVLPQEAIVHYGSLLHSWFDLHKRIIKKYFNQLVNEKGIQYFIENRIDFYELFSMDGIMKMTFIRESK